MVGGDGPMATCTVNAPEYSLQANHVLIKDYSENEGMLSALEEAGIVRSTGMSYNVGFVRLYEAEVLI